MKCSHCGGEISARVPFCGLCGSYTDPGERRGGEYDEYGQGDEYGEYDGAAALNPAPYRPPPPRGARAEVSSDDGADWRDEAMLAEGDASGQALPAEYRSSYEDAFSAMIGEEVEDYRQRFEAKSIFNVYAFFLGPLWYAYRKMLGLAFVMAFTSVFCGLVGLYFQCTGDMYYKKYIEKHAKELAKLESGSTEWVAYVEAHGGTSLASVLIYFGAVVGVGILLMALRSIF